MSRTKWHLVSRTPVTGGGGGAAPEVIVPPSIADGSRTTGAVLSLNTGAWTVAPTSYTYQWRSQDDIWGANDAAIGGATSSTYAPGSGLNNKYVYCVVTPYNGATAGMAYSTRKTQIVSGAKTTVTMDWVEEVATDAYNGGSQISVAWGVHQNAVAVFEDGVVRLAYPRRVSSVQYTRVMKRTAAATWSQDTEQQNNDIWNIVVDPLTNLPILGTWPNTERVPKLFYGAGYANSVTVNGSWESYDDTTRHYGGFGIGPDGSIVITEVHITGDTASNVTWDFNNLRLYNGTWTQGTQQAMNLATGSVTPSGERFAYPYVLPYCSAGIGSGASDRFGYKALRDVENPIGSGTYHFDAVRLWHAGYGTTSGIVSVQVVSNPGTDYNNPIDGFADPLNRVWMTRTIGGAMRLDINNLDGSNTSRLADFNLSNFNDGYGRTRVIADSRGRYWGLWYGAGATLGLKVMQLTPSGTEPTGAITVSQGSVTSLGSSLSSWTGGEYGFYIACPRGGNYVDNRIYGMFTPAGTGADKVVAFCIHLPD